MADHELPVAYAGLQGLSWVTPDELKLLHSLVNEDSRVLEVGTACGVTAAKLADLSRPLEIVCVDTFVESDDPSMADSDHDRWRKWKANARPCMRLWYGDLASFARVVAPGTFDVVFVDADHTMPGVLTDLVIGAKLLAGNGVLLAHDYGCESWPDVKRAIDHFMRTFGWRTVALSGSLVAMMKSR